MFVYINEAHAHDVWPIGLSAGTINYSHKDLDDRLKCAQKFKKEYDIQAPIYMDNMDNSVQNVLASWPFRYFLIKYSEEKDAFVFDTIGEPLDAEFDIANLLL